MSTDASELVVGANGTIRVADLESTVPTTATGPYSADWLDLGFTTEDGVKLRDSKTMAEIKAWQSFYTIRRIITGRDLLVTFSLQQWNAGTFGLAFGGGEVVPVSDGWKYTPPSPEIIDERMLAVDWEDGDRNYRLIIFRGTVTDAVETEITRQKEADLPVAFGLTADGTVEPWLFYTDDPAFS